jgi:hypothetical protein
MTQMEFRNYEKILQQKTFVIYPTPDGLDSGNNKFDLLDDSKTHLTVHNTVTNKDYMVPLILVEFANPGVLRLTRETKPFNGSFV